MSDRMCLVFRYTDEMKAALPEEWRGLLEWELTDDTDVSTQSTIFKHEVHHFQYEPIIVGLFGLSLVYILAQGPDGLGLGDAAKL